MVEIYKIQAARLCLGVQTDGGKATGHIGVLQSLARDFPGSRIVWTELLGTVAEALDSEQESLDPTEEATVSMQQLCGLSMEAVVSLANHVQKLQSKLQISQGVDCVHMLWHAECTAAEALVRHIQLEMSRGDTAKAVQLVQASCEWFSCPRVSCAPPLLAHAPFVGSITACTLPAAMPAATTIKRLSANVLLHWQHACGS